MAVNVLSKLVKGTILKYFVTKCMLLTFWAIKIKKKTCVVRQRDSWLQTPHTLDQFWLYQAEVTARERDTKKTHLHYKTNISTLCGYFEEFNYGNYKTSDKLAAFNMRSTWGVMTAGTVRKQNITIFINTMIQAAQSTILGI